MHTHARRVLLWAPRVICIAFTVFLGLLSMDVLGQGYGPMQTLMALLIHLIPTYVVVIVLVIAWRHQWVGAIAFAGLALFYVGMTGGRMSPVTYLIICGPPLVAAVLFAANWIYRYRE